MFAAALGEAPPPEDGDLSAAHRVAGEAAVAAFRSPGAMERSVALALGTVPGTNALGLALTDAVVLGWDLAMPTWGGRGSTSAAAGCQHLGRLPVVAGGHAAGLLVSSRRSR
jgi:hypothetical protein